MQPALLDQEGRLLLGAGNDALRLLLGLLDDPLTLGVDPLGGPDLLRHGHAQLIDEPQGGVLVDHDVGRERQLLAVRQQRFQALDEEDDVDDSGPPARGGGATDGCAPDRPIMARADVDQRRASAAVRAAWAAAGTMDVTSPPKLAISLTRLELT